MSSSQVGPIGRVTGSAPFETLLKAVASPTRYRVLRTLNFDWIRLRDISSKLAGIPEPTVLRNLQVLVSVELAQTDGKGNYRITETGLGLTKGFKRLESELPAIYSKQSLEQAKKAIPRILDLLENKVSKEELSSLKEKLDLVSEE